MKEIPLTQGYVALVDDADFEAVNAFKWYASVNRKGVVYARRTRYRLDGSDTSQGMHRFLLPGVKQVDHRDGDGRNNRRYNLRAATSQQNSRAFQRKRPTASSQFRGVNLHSKGGWVARIRAEGGEIYLGYFTSEKDAARAYDTAARKYFKEFATPNFNLSNEPTFK